MVARRRERFDSNTYSVQRLFRSEGSSDFHFEIPPFQRDYTWGEERWRDLWRDIAKKATDSRRRRGLEHFLGVVLLQDVESSTRRAQKVQVIDGQQRLLTLAALLAALRDEGFDYHAKAVDPFMRGSTTRWSGLKADTQAVMDQLAEGDFAESFPRDAATHPLALAYRTFRMQLRLGQDRGGDLFSVLERLPKRGPELEEWPQRIRGRGAWNVPRLGDSVLNHLVTVGIHLPPEEQEATGVFESLNGANTPLTEFDKVRVLVFTRTGGRSGPYVQEFLPVESRLLETSFRGKVKSVGDQFLYDYTLARIDSFWPHERPAATRTHEAFKEFALRAAPEGDDSAFRRKVLAPTIKAAEIFPLAVADRRALEAATPTMDPRILLSIRAINGYSSGPPVPLVMRILLESRTSPAEKLKRLHLVEGLLIRATLARVKFTTLRSEMTRLLRDTPVSAEPRTLAQALARLLDRMNVAADADLIQAAANEPIYEGLTKAPRSALTQLLRSLEHSKIRNVSNLLEGGKGRHAYTVEHIFPQGSPVPRGWKTAFSSWGMTSDDIAEAFEHRHCLGNLVLLSRVDNSGFSNRPFSEKKQMLKESTEPLLMYRDVTRRNTWSAAQIQTRGRDVARTLLDARPLRRSGT